MASDGPPNEIKKACVGVVCHSNAESDDKAAEDKLPEEAFSRDITYCEPDDKWDEDEPWTRYMVYDHPYK